MNVSVNSASRLCVCAGERIKLIGAVNGFFPDMGHHLAKEMNGMWLHPIKLLDGFWLRFADNDSDGEVDTWICADSFNNLPYGNEFHYKNGLSHTPVEIKRFQFSPDDTAACYVRYTFKNNSRKSRSVSAELLARVDLRPVWLAESIGVFDGLTDTIEYIEELRAFHAKDGANEWHTVFGCEVKPDLVSSGEFFGPEITAGNGVSGSLVYNFDIPADGEVCMTFVFAGSDESKSHCVEQYKLLTVDAFDYYLEKKKNRYNEINLKSEFDGEARFKQVYDWTKVNNDWLIQHVPSIGRGLVAGLSEYPWWFGCDSSYALQGVLAIGEPELAKQTLGLVLDASEKCNGNGRIVHEIITNGAIANKGNVQETAHFIYIVWEYYKWTNDIEFLHRCIGYIRKSIAWLIEMDDDNDLFPSGYGIIEIAGLNMEMIDTAVYTCTAFDIWSHICRLTGDIIESEHAAQMYNKLKAAINSRFWIEKEGLFGDAITSDEVVRSKVHQISGLDECKLEAMIKNGSAEERAWLLNEAWIICTPMETGIADSDKAHIALEKMHSERFVGRYGMYLSGILRNQMMTINTGVLATAQAMYGYSDRALELINLTFDTFSMATPGSISEMSPDYGCFVQGWTIYTSTIHIRYFFGLQPNAYEKHILFKPQMPGAWNNASIKNVIMLDGNISVKYYKEDGIEHYELVNETSYPVLLEAKGKININGVLVSRYENKIYLLNGKGSVSVDIQNC